MGFVGLGLSQNNGLSPYPERVNCVLDGADDGEGREFAGLWVLGGVILDVHPQYPKFAFDLDVVAIALQAGHGNHLDLRSVGSDTSQTDCGGHVQVRRKPLHSLPLSPGEDFHLIFQTLQADTVLNQVGGA